MEKLTPMMKQYIDLKNQHKDCILFFRLGDFYEMFFDDAITASQELEITLTGRDCGQEKRAPMCGVPHHSAENYISKLITKGYKVAICEQVEDPASAKGIVKRDVIRVVTPGTVINPNMLNQKENNFLMSIYIDESGAGISYVDISTGELRTTEFTKDTYINELIDEASKINPKEIIINTNSIFEEIQKMLQHSTTAFISNIESWYFEYSHAVDTIKRHFNVHYIDGFGLDNKKRSTASIGALLDYLTETQKNSLSHINNINIYSLENYMILDRSTLNHLELTETIKNKDVKGSLLWIIDKTSTAMGGRKLRQWLKEPLINIDDIKLRLDAVEELSNNVLSRENIKDYLKKVYDLERLCARVSYGNANARDLIALKNSINVLPDIKNIVNDFKSILLCNINEEINSLDNIKELIDNAIEEEPPVTIKEGGIIKRDYNEELYQLKTNITEGKNWIANLESTEKEKTNIKSLKVGFNKVFGYYIEVTKSYYDLVPENYIRKQTLANAERYITPELKEVEAKVLNAEAKINQLEYEIFIEIRNEIKKYIDTIQKTSQAVSALDVLNSFAEVSSNNDYIKPIINDSDTIKISNGRHPVIEQMISNNLFVENDTYINNFDTSFLLITGPNMSGKSTYMRQVALIVLLAQVGCFVPASHAQIGIVDRIFTRIGASDNLSQGQSTFLVEMSELAYILNNATNKSLIILDEIGRGTSTYDGLSIAWAVVEYLCGKEGKNIRTLFATHYHELTQLENTLLGFKNLNVDVKENKDDVVFLHKIIEGSANKSYGIEVAKLAGVPNEVIENASAKLQELEQNNSNIEINSKSNNFGNISTINEQQISFLDTKNQDLIDKLQNIDMLNINPMQAMNLLYELVTMVKDEEGVKHA